jgi:hypothetical protein
MSTETRSTLRLLRQPVLVVWSLYVIFIPFYVVRGGLPQPGDALILPLIPMAFVGWNGRLPRDTLRAVRWLGWFTLWVVLVNLAWALILWAWGVSLLFPLYYVYNGMFFLAAVVLYQRFGEGFLRLTLYLVYATVGFQVAASFVMIGSHGRSRLFFHNPNQLGYYALLAGCIIALTHARLKVPLIRSSIALAACGYLALLSTSRSSVAGIVLLVMLLTLSNPRVIIVTALLAAGLAIVETPATSSIDTLQTRVTEDRYADRTFFEERGYDRIYNNPIHTVLGAGEGNPGRFAETTMLGAAEIHSSIGTLIFSYGIVGCLLFAAFVRRMLKGVSIRTGLMLLPPALYSMAHQGLRFTMLWVMLALFAALKEPKR